MSNNQPPYHFVSNLHLDEKQKNTLLHEALLHHQTHEDTFSGEIRCELNTQTPAIFAAYQHLIEGKSKLSNLKNLLPKEYSELVDKAMAESTFEKKSLLFPLTYGDQTVIAGSSIKGMLRHSISALTSQPMLKVQEQTYSYRPNLTKKDEKESYRIETFPAIVSSVVVKENNDKEIKIKIIKEIVYSENLSKHGEFSEQKLKLKIPPSFKDNLSQSQDYRRIIIKPEEIKSNNPNFKEILKDIKAISIPSEIMDQYNKTTRHLINTTTGHISKRHPQITPNTNIQNIIKAITESRNIEQYQYIFVEVESKNEEDDKILSYGNHYYYHWRYKDSVRMLNAAYGGEKLRPELSLSPKEGKNAYTLDSKKITPSELSITRSLFGFVADQNDEKDNSNNKLAGRVAINHALEVITPDKDTVLKQNICAILEPTGSPKASAVEFYIQQNGNTLMNTYGDDYFTADPSRLNGRKFYLHHSSAEKCKQFINPKGDKLSDFTNKLAPLVKGVTPENTLYRFSVNVRSLRDWELGLVLAALQPERVFAVLLSNEATTLALPKSKNWIKTQKDKGNTHLGIKLGYGRPFGFGSCTIQPHLSLEGTKQGQSADTFISKALHKFAQNHEFDNVLLQWMKVHNLNTNQAYHYPIAGKDKNAIGYHFDVRKKHIKNRRLNNPKKDSINTKNGKYLADLD